MVSPWAHCTLEPHERWHPHFVWVRMVRPASLPGKKVLVLFEEIRRRWVNGRWEYDLPD